MTGPTDGSVPEIDEAQASGISTSEVVTARDPVARWVRSLNHLGNHDMNEGPLPKGTPDRRAAAIADDDREAKRLVRSFIESIGFDAVDISPLSNDIALQPGTPMFGRGLSQTTLTERVRRWITDPTRGTKNPGNPYR